MNTTNPSQVTALRLAQDGQRRCRAEIDDLAAQAREKRTELRDWDRQVAEAISVLVGRTTPTLFDAAPSPGDLVDADFVVTPEPVAKSSNVEDLDDSDADGLPAAVRSQGLALVGVPDSVLKKLADYGEIKTIGELIDWVEEDGASEGGMSHANGSGLWGCLRSIRVASQHIGPTVDAVYAFLKAKNCDPRAKPAPAAARVTKSAVEQLEDLGLPSKSGPAIVASEPEPPLPLTPPAEAKRFYGWDITYRTHTNELLTCHYVGTESQARKKAMLRPRAERIIACEGLTEEQWKQSYGKGRM